jgi:Domain of unknown function (DUF1707)
VVEPDDEITGVEGHSRPIASQADREQVLGALEAAFVQGRLTKDEFDHRVGQALATYAELDTLTADIPARWIETQPPKPARESHNRKVIQRGTAVGAGIYVQLAQVSSGQSRTLWITRVAWSAASTGIICPIPKLTVRDRKIRLPTAGMQVEMRVASPRPSVGVSGTPGTCQDRL